MFERLKALINAVKIATQLSKVYDSVGGRTTLFAWFFAVNVTVLAYQGKLTNVYVAAITALQTLILAHSVKEDVYGQKNDSNKS